MPWYRGTAHLATGFNPVASLQAPSEDEARAQWRRELASEHGAHAVGSITIRPGRPPTSGHGVIA